jgi:hypothetical protein
VRRDVQREMLRGTVRRDVQREMLRGTVSRDVQREMLRGTVSRDVQREMLRGTVGRDVQREMLRGTVCGILFHVLHIQCKVRECAGYDKPHYNCNFCKGPVELPNPRFISIPYYTGCFKMMDPI